MKQLFIFISFILTSSFQIAIACSPVDGWRLPTVEEATFNNSKWYVTFLGQPSAYEIEHVVDEIHRIKNASTNRVVFITHQLS